MSSTEPASQPAFLGSTFCGWIVAWGEDRTDKGRQPRITVFFSSIDSDFLCTRSFYRGPPARKMGADTHLEQGMVERKNVHDGAHVMLSLAG